LRRIDTEVNVNVAPQYRTTLRNERESNLKITVREKRVTTYVLIVKACEGQGRRFVSKKKATRRMNDKFTYES
jgi:hypothetical protein